jgi:hypothetical protein
MLCIVAQVGGIERGRDDKGPVTIQLSSNLKSITLLRQVARGLNHMEFLKQVCTCIYQADYTPASPAALQHSQNGTTVRGD